MIVTIQDFRYILTVITGTAVTPIISFKVASFTSVMYKN